MSSRYQTNSTNDTDETHRATVETGKVFGRENLGQVIETGNAVDRIKVGDWICLARYCAGGSLLGGYAQTLHKLFSTATPITHVGFHPIANPFQYL